MMNKRNENDIRDLAHRISTIEHVTNNLKTTVRILTNATPIITTELKNIEYDLSNDQQDRNAARLIGTGFIGTFIALIPIVFSYISALPSACQFPVLMLNYSISTKRIFILMLITGIVGSILYIYSERRKQWRRRDTVTFWVSALILGTFIAYFSSGPGGFFNGIIGFPSTPDDVAAFCIPAPKAPDQ
jgi:hypothetical protein